MNQENILEGTWLEDMIIQKGVKRGLEQGLEQGVKQGLEQGLLSFVKTHFPAELALANQQVGLIMTQPQAQELLEKLYVARTDDEVKAILLSIPRA